MPSLDEYEVALRLRKEEMLQRARNGGLLSFSMLTFEKYEANWHHLITCSFLNQFIKKKIRRLIVEMPPRYGKSELTSRRLPALLHGLYPDDEILAASYNSELASDMTVDVQRIMDRPDYAEIFPYVRITPAGTMSKYARTRNEHELIPVQRPDRYWHYPRGSYRSAGIGGSFTGRGANWVLIDDPFKNRQEADSKAERDRVFKFYNSALRTRLEKEGSVLITMTRWHSDDLVGRLMKLAKSDPMADQFTLLSLPAIREETSHEYDMRKPGEPLWPAKYTLDELMRTKASIGSREFASLYQQSPVADGGNLIRANWIKWYHALPPKFDQVIQSWDFKVKKTETGSYICGQVWGRIKADFYLIHQVRGRWDFPMACNKLLEVSRMYPRAGKKVIEAKATGPAVMETLKHMVPGLVECTPTTDKVSRLNAVSYLYEGGNVYYPSDIIAPWINDHVIELTEFPSSAYDDQVDCASQALDVLRSGTTWFAPISGHGSGTIFK
jgi:predicted phage terminase large subunit-like protein